VPLSTSARLLASISDLSRTRSIVDALLCRLKGSKSADKKLSQEESERARTTEVVAYGREQAPRAPALGEADSRAAGDPGNRTGPTHRPDGVARKPPTGTSEPPGEQP
jgi:hypothetical protein